MTKKTRPSNQKNQTQIECIEAIEGATLEELCYKLNEKTAKQGYILLEGSLQSNRNEFFQNHTAILYKEKQNNRRGKK